jgi:hypothetical protein
MAEHVDASVGFRDLGRLVEFVRWRSGHFSRPIAR